MEATHGDHPAGRGGDEARPGDELAYVAELLFGDDPGRITLGVAPTLERAVREVALNPWVRFSGPERAGWRVEYTRVHTERADVGAEAAALGAVTGPAGGAAPGRADEP